MPFALRKFTPCCLSHTNELKLKIQNNPLAFYIYMPGIITCGRDAKKCRPSHTPPTHAFKDVTDGIGVSYTNKTVKFPKRYVMTRL